MKRRTLLAATGVVLAGCVTSTPDGGSDESEANDENESDDEGNTESDENGEATESEELSDEEIVEQFRETLEDAGFERVDVDPVDDGLALGYDATGTGESDVAAEIELITDGYTTTVERGLSPTALEASAYDPNDGDVLDSFTVDTELVDAYLSESLEWHELLTRVADTFVSYDRDDESESNDEDGAEDEAGTEAEAEDETSEAGAEAKTDGDETEERNDSGGDGEAESGENGDDDGR